MGREKKKKNLREHARKVSLQCQSSQAARYLGLDWREDAEEEEEEEEEFRTSYFFLAWLDLRWKKTNFGRLLV